KRATDKARTELKAATRDVESVVARRTTILQRSTDLLKEVTQVMTQGVVVIAPDGEIELLNAQATDYLPQAAWSEGVNFQSLHDPENSEDWSWFKEKENHTQSRQDEKGSWIKEHYLRRSDGGFILFLSPLSPDMVHQQTLKSLTDKLNVSKDEADSHSPTASKQHQAMAKTS
ncbi:MAG: hypothetical protein AAF603_11125, partial [Pseudomonadota bacterium]